MLALKPLVVALLLALPPCLAAGLDGVPTCGVSEPRGRQN